MFSQLFWSMLGSRTWTVYFLLSLKGLFSHGEIQPFMLSVSLLYEPVFFFPSRALRFSALPLYNRINIIKHEGDSLGDV